MAWRGRGDWRWVAAAFLIAALVLGFGFILRATNLGTAANVAQLVSLAPLILGLATWSRARRAARVTEVDRAAGPGAAADGRSAAVPLGGTPVPRQLPAAVAGFAGRAAELGELARLVEEGVTPGGAVVISAIGGTAGIGKTALAVQFAHQVADRFPDGQLYVNLRGFDPAGMPMAPAEAVRAFLDALGVPSRLIPVSLDAQAALYRSLLAGRRVLVVLDNARDSEQVRPLLPGSSGCCVVVTSRSRLTGLIADGARPLTLGLLTDADARLLLARRLGEARVAAHAGAAGEIIGGCARLPLALSVVAARAAANPEFPLTALARELRDIDGRLQVLDSGEAAASVTAVFSWSYQQLSEQGARLFRLLGRHPWPEFTAPTAASLAAVPLTTARPLLAELARACLITEQVPGRFAFHDLLRAYAVEQARLTDGEAELAAAELRMFDHYLRTAYDAMLTVYPARPRLELPSPPPGVSPERHDAYEDVIGWFRAERDTLLAAVALLGDRGAHQHNRGMDAYCWQLAWSSAPMLMRLGEYPRIEAALRTGLSAAERLGDLSARGRVHTDLGYAYTRLGELAEADWHLRRALDIFAISGDWAGVGLAYHGLTVLLDEQGRHADALPHAREALRLRSSFGDRTVVAYAENTVGWIYANLGQHAEALSHCQRALELHLELGVRSGAADTLDSIGFAYAGLGDHQQAIVHFQRAVEMFQEIGDPRGESEALIHLGDAYLALGQDDETRQSWERALALVTVTPGGDTSPVRARLALLAKTGPE